MKRIETRDNEFLMQFRKTIRSSFPPALDFQVDYYLGEDKGVQGLYFSITSRFGRIYTRIRNLKEGELVYEIEDEFMNQVINDLIINGLTLLNINAFESVSPERVGVEVKAKLFKHYAPRKLLYIN
jgi:hypothetical protein